MSRFSSRSRHSEFHLLVTYTASGFTTISFEPVSPTTARLTTLPSARAPLAVIHSLLERRYSTCTKIEAPPLRLALQALPASIFSSTLSCPSRWPPFFIIAFRLSAPLSVRLAFSNFFSIHLEHLDPARAITRPLTWPLGSSGSGIDTDTANPPFGYPVSCLICATTFATDSDSRLNKKSFTGYALNEYEESPITHAVDTYYAAGVCAK